MSITPLLSENAQLALDTIHQKPRQGVPTWIFHIMEHRQIERFARTEPGSYVKDPERVYVAMSRNVGVCFIDQFIPTNPLGMNDHGYVGNGPSATTGAERIEVDGMLIDSPEAVCEHLERFEFPRLRQQAAAFDEDARTAEIIQKERDVQAKFGGEFLKTGYAFIRFPGLAYGRYGYVHYFCAYALFPDVIERHFALQADVHVRNNRAAARAYIEADLPPLYRLDHDMADSRGTLVSIKSLDRIWFPHFARALEPMLKTDVRMIWHCDGNLMQMVPRLLACGIRGFQGFQYEDGMDYERICRMTDRDGRPLFIIAGSSVTRTLPRGTPDDVRREMKFLVEHGPKVGLALGPSSSVAPGVPPENLDAWAEGLAYYRTHGRP